jgi:hypothetical protein
VLEAPLTVVCCPNSTVGSVDAGTGWAGAIASAFPDSVVRVRTLAPAWPAGAKHRYLVLNYEAFQQPDSSRRLADLLAREAPAFVVIDEVHLAKERDRNLVSRRRRNVQQLVAAAGAANPDLRVLGMSATPVINDLHEGRSMVELVTGQEHPELGTAPTVENCLSLHQRLVSLGIRWKPEYRLVLDESYPEIDVSGRLDDIRALGPGDILGLEQILTQERLATVLANVKAGTCIYTHLVEGIVPVLREALEHQGWRVGVFTGHEKDGLQAFLAREADVLIASSAIATGVDGLQDICDRLIVCVLPWTAAEYEQLVGRFYRQGQRSDRVDVIVPVTHADVAGERWSWCDAKLARIRFKKSIADAAVDGAVPAGRLRDQAEVYRALMGWLKRLSEGLLREAERTPVAVPPVEDAFEAS